MLESTRPRDTPAGLIETMHFGAGRAMDVPLHHKYIGSIDPLCLRKLPPEGRNNAVGTTDRTH